MKVLVACEESQAVCKAFREKGHEAYSCDIQECSGGHPEWHIKGNVLKILNPSCFPILLTGTPTGIPVEDCVVKEWRGITFYTMDGKLHTIEGKWDLIIAHPPCTFMSKAGARWMFPKAGEISQERLKLATEAKEFFFEILNADCERIVVENPVPLKIVGLPTPTQKVQPYEFGHPFSKCTCLWIKGLPKLKPTKIVSEYKPFLPSNTGGLARGRGGSRGVARNAKDASKTFEGIARAMAEQWGGEFVAVERLEQMNIFDSL